MKIITKVTMFVSVDEKEICKWIDGNPNVVALNGKSASENYKEHSTGALSWHAGEMIEHDLDVMFANCPRPYKAAYITDVPTEEEIAENPLYDEVAPEDTED